MNDPHFIMNAVIVDDEAPSRSLLKRFLANHPRTRLIGEAATGSQAVALIHSQSPDIAFLDIRMPEGDGFKVLEQPETTTMIVFITAYDQFALRAFDEEAFDYLLKPFDQSRVFRTLNQAYLRISEKQALAKMRSRNFRFDSDQNCEPAPLSGYPKRLMLKEKGRIFFLAVDQIRWISAEGVYARLHLDQGQHLIRRSLNDLAASLDPLQFGRIHRSTIVNLEAIATMESAFRGDYFVHLTSGEILKMSRYFRDTVFKNLNLF